MDNLLSPSQAQLRDKIISELESPLPGWSSQMPLSPIRHTIHPATPADATEAAVNLLLKPNADGQGYTMIYIKRGTKYGADQHKGQVSFAGGKRETTDLSLKDCAIRETEEELGISAEKISVLGALSPFYVFVSGFIVHPYIAIVPPDTTYAIDTDEVDYVIEVGLDHMLDPDTLRYRQHPFRGTIIEQSPYFDLGNGEILWGATAMMTNEFLTLMRR